MEKYHGEKRAQSCLSFGAKRGRAGGHAGLNGYPGFPDEMAGVGGKESCREETGSPVTGSGTSEVRWPAVQIYFLELWLDGCDPKIFVSPCVEAVLSMM